MPTPNPTKQEFTHHAWQDGGNSQWGTDFRRDYLFVDELHDNVVFTASPAADGATAIGA